MDQTPKETGSVSHSDETPRPLSARAGKTKSPRERQLEKLRLFTDEESEDLSHNGDIFREMEAEKERYPGASEWAPDEERLFEILFMRQDLPMLPSSWEVDLRGVPIYEVAFETSEEHPPIVYAHEKDFRATMALIRLIDLTSEVRSSIQLGMRYKVPRIIKKTIDKYINWAAQDGGYADLRIVPNIMTEIVDTKLGEAQITEYIQGRMRDLARLQREFLREDRDTHFWEVVKPSIMTSPRVKLEPEDESPTPRRVAQRRAYFKSPSKSTDELAVDTQAYDGVKIKVEPGQPGLKRRRPFPSPTSTEYGAEEVDELAQEVTPSKKLKPLDWLKSRLLPKPVNGESPRKPPKAPEKNPAGQLSSEKHEPLKSATPGTHKGVSEPHKEQQQKQQATNEGSPPEPSLLERPKVSTDIPDKDVSKPPLSEKQNPPKAPPPETPSKNHEPEPILHYRRPPPVVYGFFILNSSVLLLTTDAARGDNAYVSFHVQTNFQDVHQSVWNALTIALAVCLARDELRTRREDFEPLPVVEESDPDA